jgi:sugar phosphate permease
MTTTSVLDVQVTQPAAPLSARDEWRAGWRIVAGAAVGMGTGVGLYVMVRSLFVLHITREFGWTRGDIGIAGMVAFVTGAIAMPIIGRTLDRVGHRRVVLICVPAFALVYPMIALQPGPFRFHLMLMVYAGIFGGGTAAIAYTRPVVAAFQRQRGLALGLATAGTSIAGIIAPPILAAVISAYGWRAGLYVMSFMTGVVGLPIALFLIGNGARTAPGDRRTTSVGLGQSEPRGLTLRDATRRSRFWLMAITLAVVNIPGAGVVAQLAPLLGDKGFSDASAANAMSIYAGGVLLGRLIAGFSLDRLPTWVVAAVMTVIPAIGIVLLRGPSPSFWLAATAVAMIGLQQGSEVDLIGYIVSRSFGIAHYGAIYGTLGIGGAIATAMSFVFFGKVHDLTGSYDLALSVGAVAFCLGAIGFAASGRALEPPGARHSM